MTERIVIVGAGHAGGSAAKTLRELGFSGSIQLVGDEAEPPYERPTLSKEFLSGAEASPTYLADEAAWSALGVELILGVSAVAIDRVSRSVSLSDGRSLAYDRLILAMGGKVRRLPIASSPRIHYLRTADDARALALAARPGARALVVGGGVIGLEAASTLTDLGLSVTVLEAGDRLLGRNTPAEAAAWLAEAHARIGVDVRLGVSVAAVEDRPDRFAALLSNGEALECDLMVVGVGILPCAEIAADAGLPCDGGVLVDEAYRSPADPDIFAIGDLAVRPHGDDPAPRRMETWAHAQTSARIAALTILGQEPEAEQTPWFWTAQCGHMLQIAGHPEAATETVSRGERVRLFLRDGRLVGVACLDQPRDFAAARRLIGKTLSPQVAADPSADLRKAAA